MADPTQHPGSLSTMGKIWEGIKHVGGKALKWAGKAAVVAGIVGIVLAAAPAGVMGVLSTLTFGLIPSGTTTLVGGMLTGLKLGAILGGVTGAVSAVGGLPDAIKDAEAENISNYERGEAREMRMGMLQQRQAEGQLSLMQKAQGMGLAPGATPGMDQSQGRGL